MNEHYNIFEFIKILKKIVDYNYSFVKFPCNGEFISSYNEVLLRHDVDFSLTAARNIAFEEFKLQIQSTFFIYLNSPIYNVAFEKDKKLIKEILSFNHDIALHYDDKSSSTVENEIEILKRMYPSVRCDIISLHKPNIDMSCHKLRNNYNCKTTYDAQFFQDIEYISDSKCNFNKGKFSTLINSRKSFQLLLHPIWWFYEGNTIEEKFKKLCNLKIDEILENMKNGISQPLKI